MSNHLGGFESTHIFGTGQDILDTTKHIDLWQEDLERLRAAGITKVRYSVPWHRIERQNGIFDWTWIDQPLRFMRENGIDPILDPLHYTSFPAWLTEGFLHPDFPKLYSSFLKHISDRYPFVRSYTLFNEPLRTTLLCSYTGMWYPHHSSDESFVKTALQVARAICCGCDVLRNTVSPRFVHVDAAEHHRAVDRRSIPWVDFVNARRFLLTDLILGRVREHHELYGYLSRHGASVADLRWFEAHPATIDVLGLGYYPHSETDWAWSREEGRAEIKRSAGGARGFASIAEDYVSRYSFPILLAGTNMVGTIDERIAWLRFMEQECEEIALSGIDFRGFCWYPSIDATGWSNGCTPVSEQMDRQGVWSLEPENLARIDTELSVLYSQLARGKIHSMDLPIHSFGLELERRLRKYSTLPGRWNSQRIA